MSRSFVKNLLWLQVLNWAVKPLWILLIEREVQLRLGDVWYGQYYVLFNAALLFAVVLDAGLANYTAREIASKNAWSRPLRLFGLRLGLGAVYALLVLGLGLWQDLPLGLLLWVAGNQIMASTVLLLRAVLQGQHRFKADAILSISDRLVALLACSYFLWGGNFEFSALSGLQYFVAAQSLGYAASLALGLTLVLSRQPAREDSADPQSWFSWLGSFKWYSLMALLMTLYTRLDVLLLNMWSRVGLALPEGGNVDDAPVRDSSAAFEQAGIYAQSFRLLDAALIFTTLLSTQLLPMFAKRMANQESSDDLLKWSTRGIVVVGLVGVGIVWFVGEEILTRLYPGLYGSAAELHNASVVFGLLMSSFLPMALVHVYGTYVTAAGELKWLSGLSAAGLLLNLALNGYYIPLVGAAGAALSCLATQTFFALGCWYKSRELRGLSVLG
ncbi:MAG: hypothetical protein RL577_916 [Bacteroidota bacterium]